MRMWQEVMPGPPQPVRAGIEGVAMAIGIRAWPDSHRATRRAMAGTNQVLPIGAAVLS